MDKDWKRLYEYLGIGRNKNKEVMAKKINGGLSNVIICFFFHLVFNNSNFELPH